MFVSDADAEHETQTHSHRTPVVSARLLQRCCIVVVALHSFVSLVVDLAVFSSSRLAFMLFVVVVFLLNCVSGCDRSGTCSVRWLGCCFYVIVVVVVCWLVCGLGPP